MAEITQGQIGPEAKYALKFEGGKLAVQVDYQGALLGAGLSVSIGADQVIEAIEAAIPGKLDDAVLDLLKVALKAV